MPKKSIENLLEDIRLINQAHYELVEAIRALVKQNFTSCAEEVKYGGILFSSGIQFCGIFAYKEHVSVEFGSGASIKDPFGYLQGAGKMRRHLKLFSIADIQQKKLADYLDLALEAAKASA